MSSSFEKSVKGGTKIKLAPPKSKYVEHLLVATNAGEAGVAEVFRTLKERLRDSTWTIVFKSLIIVHLMIKEGQKDITLQYLAQAPRNRLAINTFTDVQTQGQNIRLYSNYLVSRAEGFADTKVDYVRSGIGRMKSLTIDKGLLRETESIQAQIKTLVKCDLLGTENENEISLTAFRLLTKDLMDLFAVMNEAVMNVLSHYFELSKVDAEHAIAIYKTFAKQTDQVVQYLSIARQYEYLTKLEIPKIKHAPTSLAASLQEYIDDHDFETNRRQYLAERQSKDGGKIGSSLGKTFAAPSKPPQSTTRQPEVSKPENITTSQPATSKAQPSELIDFFDSIDPAPQPVAQAPAVQQYAQPTAQGFEQPYMQQANSAMPTGQVSTNPFNQVQNGQYQQQQPQSIQPNFTGAGFGGYGPQPQQQQQQQQPQQTGYSASNPFMSGMPQAVPQIQQPFDAQQQNMPQIQQPFDMQQQQQQIQPQSTNPFRQSMMITGATNGFPVPPPQQPQQPQQQQQQSTNPFARSPAQQSPMQTGSALPTQLQPQPTGTNPFARQQTPTQQQPQQTGAPASFLAPAVTGSTNPFRQSTFVNQQTGQGWQNAGQGTLGGWEQMETMPVFPRPGQA